MRDLVYELVISQLLQRGHHLHVYEPALRRLSAFFHQVLAFRLQNYQLFVQEDLVLDVFLCSLYETPLEKLVGRL